MPRRDIDDQPSLFPEDRPPAPLLRQEEPASIAAALPAPLRLGTSSWTFPGWSGLVYPAGVPASEASLAKRGLSEYAQAPLLRTVGLDRAFYRPLVAAQCRDLAVQAGAGFRFLVKASRALTHRGGGEDRFLDAGYARDLVVAPLVEGFGAALGTLLFQFPQMHLDRSGGDRFRRDLDRFLSNLPRGPAYAVEVRDAPLLDDRLAALLAGHGTAFGHALHPSMPSLSEQRRRLGPRIDAVAAPAVLRWLLRREHSYEGAKDLYAPFAALREPDPPSRREVAAWCLSQCRSGRETFVIANNKAEGSAPLTLLELARAIVAEMRAVTAPQRREPPSAGGP
jgi:uncharacterized protein YecE (DUF72 family)